MKRTLTLISFLLIGFLLLGCSATKPDGESKENTPTDNVQEDIANNNNNDNVVGEDDTVSRTDEAGRRMFEQMKEERYVEFELKAIYEDGTKYVAAIDQDVDRDEDENDDWVEAKLIDTRKDVILHGEKAFNELFPRVKELSITSGTTEKDAIAQALEHFDLDKNYKKLELELETKDGDSFEFHDVK